MLARSLRAEGRTDTELLAELRQADGSLHHTVRALREGIGLSASEANRMIIDSGVWSDHRDELPASPHPTQPLGRDTAKPSVAANVAWGVKYGLGFATMLSVLVGILALLSGSAANGKHAALDAGTIIGFYYVVGTVGGVAAGLMRPLTRFYLGRIAMAYVVLFIVYGGGTLALYPAFSKGDSDPPAISSLLLVWAAICVVLAPIYEKQMR
jgi:hypothetical protein